MKHFRIRFFFIASLLLFSAATFAQPGPASAVRAVLETAPVYDRDGYDADDPAIWVHPDDEESSLVLGTLKEGGMGVYNLQAVLLQHIPPLRGPNPEGSPGDRVPRFNNVDLIYDFPLIDEKVDLAVVSDRGLDKLRIYLIDEDAAKKGRAPLREITAWNQPWIFSEDQGEVNQKKTAYGLATAKPFEKGPTFVFVSRNATTTVAQLILFASPGGKVSYRNIREIDLPHRFSLPQGKSWTPCMEENGELPHIEGMVFDRKTGLLYIGQEDVGIWKWPVWGSESDLRLLDKVQKFGVPYSRVRIPDEEEYLCTLHWDQDPGFGGLYLKADLEGLTIFEGKKKSGYLIASSQGNDTFVIYDREEHSYTGTFSVKEPASEDRVNSCDGAMVVSTGLGRAFGEGILVVQDGTDEFPGDAERTNFKFVPWGRIARSFGLAVNPGHDVRDDD